MIEISKDLDEALVEFLRVQKYLHSELSLISQIATMEIIVPDALKKDPAQMNLAEVHVYRMFAYRAAVMAYIRNIESFCYGLKIMVLALPDETLNEFYEPHEVMAIKGEKYSVKENGNVSLGEDVRKFTTDLKFSMKTFAKAFAHDFVLDCSGDGWRKLLELVKVRNRMSHPEGFSSLMVEEEEMALAIDVDRWFSAEKLRLLGNIERRHPSLK